MHKAKQQARRRGRRGARCRMVGRPSGAFYSENRDGVGYGTFLRLLSSNSACLKERGEEKMNNLRVGVVENRGSELSIISMKEMRSIVL